MTPPEPYVKTWTRVDFDDAAAEAVLTATSDALTALDTNAEERDRYKPQDYDWGGTHYDEFKIQYANLAGTRDDVVAALVANRAKVQGAINEAQAERSLRQAQWNAWHAWYDRLTPEERGGRVRLQPRDQAESRPLRGPV